MGRGLRARRPAGGHGGDRGLDGAEPEGTLPRFCTVRDALAVHVIGQAKGILMKRRGIGDYRLAGSPTLREIDERIRAHPELPATPGKETVRRLPAGISVPLRWAIVETVFLALCARAGCDPDEPDEPERDASSPTRREAFALLWQEAVVAPPPLVPNPRSRRGAAVAAWPGRIH